MRRLSRITDVVLALLVGAAVLAIAAVRGDPLFAGTWTYVLSWLGLVGLAQVTRAPPLFTTGASLALMAAYVFYWLWQASLEEVEPLLGLGLLLSLPGLVVALLVAGIVAMLRRLRPAAAFAAGLFACIAGFALGQLATCQSLMNCSSMPGIAG